MKAILEFYLDNHDDKMAHLRAVKSTEMAIVLFEMSANIRKRVENMIDVQQLQTPRETLDSVFEEFNSLMEQQNINIDELID